MILAAHRAGRLARLWVDETRPLLQGARLTAYEARRAGMPHAVLPDAAAASLMAAGEVDMVLTGADRIAADGSVANKVGTYWPRRAGPPSRGAVRGGRAGVHDRFRRRRTGRRSWSSTGPAEEVTSLGRGARSRRPGAPAYNPAFDVTPPALVTALVTERGVAQPVNARYAACSGDRQRPRRVTCPRPLFTWNDEAHERSRAGRR